MSDLERELRSLAANLELPPTPDILSTVHHGLAAPRAGRGREWRRRLVPIGVAALAVAIGVTFAVPPARTAVLRFFGVGAVRIELVDRLPEIQPPTRLDLGTPIEPDESPIPILRSPLLGDADAVYVDGSIINQLYGDPERVRLLVTQIIGSEFTPAIGKKLVGTGTGVEFVSIPGSAEPGLWIEGRPHIVLVPGAPPRLAGNTLIWKRGDVTVRLEGALGLERAVEIAASLGG